MRSKPQSRCFCTSTHWRKASTYSTQYGDVCLIQCMACAAYRTAIPPSTDDIQRLYVGDSIYTPPPSHTYALRARSFEHVASDLENLGSRSGKLLEIGCNAGYALSVFRDRGWSVAGVEINSVTADVARNKLEIPIYRDLISVPVTELYNVILLSHTLEHLLDPLGSVRTMARHLASQGTLYVKVPNYGSHTVRYLLRGRWDGFLPLQHVWYFNYRSLNNLMSLAGFRVVRWYTRSRLSFGSHNWLKAIAKAPLVLASHLSPYDGNELVGVYRLGGS